MPLLSSIHPLRDPHEILRDALTDAIDHPLNGGWLSLAIGSSDPVVMVDRHHLMQLENTLTEWLETTC